MVASSPLSGLANFCIFCNALSHAIILSFHKNFALPSSALYSLYLEKAIVISDAKIQRRICKIIFTKKYPSAPNFPSVTLSKIFAKILDKNTTNVFTTH
jgi:hypothetical protein